MNWSKTTMTCKEFDDIIVNYIDDKITENQKIEITAHLEQCEKCKISFNYYKEIADKLQSLPQEECPDSVIEKVFHTVKIIDSKSSFLSNIYYAIIEKHSWKVQFALALLILGIFIFYPRLENKKPAQQQYTTEEIEKAKNDVQLALSYFYYYTSKTENLIEKEVLPDYLTKPLKTILKQF